LCEAIHGRGAFGRFKNLIRVFDTEEEWHKFRTEVFERIARDWCEMHHIELMG